MEDIKETPGDGGEEQHVDETPAPESSTSPAPAPIRATRSITPPPAIRALRSRTPPSSSEPVPGIRRFPTMPSQQRARFASPTIESSSRPRGRSLSTREQAELAHLPSHERESKDEEERMMPIPESRAVSPQAESARFVSPGMRRRTTTFRTQGSMRRKGTVSGRSVMNTGIASGVAGDAQSINFSLAGSPVVQEVVALNQPYVDPGYAQLNPAYDQPVNTRPVWGLAGPLPRVLRPGMVPTRSELKIDTAVAESDQRPVEDVDLEQGRIEPTLRLGKITSQLQETRRRRENSLLQAYDGSSPTNAAAGLGRSGSTRITPFPDLTEEEENLVPQDTHSSLQGGDSAQPEAGGWYPDDAASATTEHDNDQGDEHEWHEEIAIPTYEDDEVHNLHTHWSVIRLQFREPLAELLAVTCQLTLGFCANLAVTTSSSTAGDSASTCWAWGLATMVGIYVAGGISGAHLNPSISIMLWIYRGFPLRKVPIYVLAQIVGAFIAALISFGIYQKDIVTFAGSGVSLMDSGTLGSFITYPRNSWVDGSTAFFNEFTGTAILAIAVLAMGDDTNAPPGAGMSAFIIGLVIVVLSMAFGYNTGAALNPSRDLGPRLAVMALGYGADVFRNAYWVYGPWLATISGAILGGFLYDAAIFVGGESPVNYPRRRMKRAGTKWKRKWSGRIKRKVRKVRGDDRGQGEGEKIIQ